MKRTGWLGAVLLAGALAGCAHQATYNAAHLEEARKPAAQKLDGKVLVLTSAEQDAYVFKGNPTSLTGGASTLTIPLGAITRESARAAFADAFNGGADAASEAAQRKDYVLVVSPRVTEYSYEYNQLKNLGFAITPIVRATLNMRVLDAGGNATWERTYQSGDVEGSSWMVNFDPGESMSKLTHKVIYDLIAKSAGEIADQVLKPNR